MHAVGREDPEPSQPRPCGGPHVFRMGYVYTADELIFILERFGLRHTNTWGTHHVIWLTNECTFFKIARGGKSTLLCIGAEMRSPYDLEFDQVFSSHFPLCAFMQNL